MIDLPSGVREVAASAAYWLADHVDVWQPAALGLLVGLLILCGRLAVEMGGHR